MVIKEEEERKIKKTKEVQNEEKRKETFKTKVDDFTYDDINKNTNFKKYISFI